MNLQPDSHFDVMRKIPILLGLCLLLQQCVSVVDDSGLDKLTTVVDLPSLTDSRDGQVYRVIRLDEQQILVSNLRSSISGSLCVGESDPCNQYGRYYTYNEALTACPSGWHLPDDSELASLFKSLGTTGSNSTILYEYLIKEHFDVRYAGYVDANSGSLFLRDTTAFFWAHVTSGNNAEFYAIDRQSVSNSGLADKAHHLSCLCVRPNN